MSLHYMLNMSNCIWEEDNKYLSQYAVVTSEIKRIIDKHVKRYNLSGEICAWYKDLNDFYSDWCKDLKYSKTEAKKLLHGGIGEFQIIKNFGIIRYTN